MKKINVIVLALVLVICIGISVYATSSNNDPIITLSYFEMKLDEFKEEMLKNVTEIVTKAVNEVEKTENPVQNEVNQAKYEIVNITKDKTVIFEESTEFIVRRGTAIIIDPSKSNGIPNLTTGKDDKNDETVGLQNLYLVPRTDGRGISATTDLVIMIRGSYTIK